MRTVLVVDDEAGITETLSGLLSDEGYRVLVARNGKDGLRRMQEERPDIVLLDYMMPVMGGGDVLKAMCADASLRVIPVVMMSSVPRNSLPEDCKPQGFLRKPFDVDALLNELTKQLATTMA